MFADESSRLPPSDTDTEPLGGAVGGATGLQDRPAPPSEPTTGGGGGPQPPRPRRPNSLAASVRAFWPLVLLPVIILVVAGVVVGYRKHPTYTATATINVGKSDINTQATPGYVQASEALATTYSRLVTSQHVTVPVGRAVGAQAAVVASRLSSVPIPTEPTFSISGTGSSAASSVRLVNATVAALQGYTQRSSTQQGGPTQLLARYRGAETRAQYLQQKSQMLAGRLAGHVPRVTPGQVARAKVASNVAGLQAQALNNEYLNLASSGVAPQLDVLVNPTSASTTNRTSNIEKYGIIGGVGGLVIGLALAGMAGSLANRLRRRYG